MQLGMALTQVTQQSIDRSSIGITTHQGYTGDVVVATRHKGINSIGSERDTYISPQIGRMAPRTTTWTATDVDGQGHLVGNLLEYYVAIGVLEHGGSVYYSFVSLMASSNFVLFAKFVFKKNFRPFRPFREQK